MRNTNISTTNELPALVYTEVKRRSKTWSLNQSRILKDKFRILSISSSSSDDSSPFPSTPHDQLIWYPHPKHAWLLGKIVSEQADTITIVPVSSGTPDQSQTLRVFNRDQVHPFDSSHINQSKDDDLASFNELTVAPLLDTLRRRFFRLLPYTYISDIVIAVNPYKTYPHMTTLPDPLISYERNKKSRKKQNNQRPHVWAIADFAYRAMMAPESMMSRKKSQSVIISGESGSGKTISANNVMMYLTQLSTQQVDSMARSRGRASSIGDEVCVETKILACNPCLEAFGNASTTRNRNSSRFGKFIKILFNKGRIVGARMVDYLLEKARVTSQLENNRNYHIFYYLVHGASDELAQELGLRRHVKSYSYLATHEGTTNDSPETIENDADKFRNMCRCLSIADVPEEEQHALWRVLSGCLELGQIEFCLNDKDNSVQFDDKKTNIEQCVSHCAEMLGFERTNLRFLLLHRLRVTPTETIKEPYTNVKQAIAARDAFAKELYSRVFRYIVSIVNSTLAPSRDYDGVIGILDIFGFESFKKNSYEQLLINYTNETLQNLFNEYVFKNEAVLYESEGLAEIASVAYQDNLPCCRLIDAEYSRHRFHGILSILNDVTSAPLNRNLTDLDFARELKKSFVERCREEAKISSSYLDLFDPNVSMKKGKKRSSRGFYDGVSFWIRHYAGIVKYQTTGFVKKNRDRTPTQFVKCLDKSKSLFVKMFLSDMAIREQEEEQNRKRRKEGREQIKKKMGSNKKKKSHSTIASSFRSALRSLSTLLSRSNPHYIRCIKPNRIEADASKHWDAFDGAEVLSQLVKSGVLETVSIRQRGFPFRMEYSKFRRYLINRRVTSMIQDPLNVLREIKDDRKWCSMCLQHSIGPKIEDHAILKRKKYEGAIIPSQRMWIEGKTLMFGKSNLLNELDSFVTSKASRVLMGWIQFHVLLRQRILSFERSGVLVIQRKWRQKRRLREAMRLVCCVLAKMQMQRLRCVCVIQREIRRVRALRSWKETCEMLHLKEKERMRILEERRKIEEKERRLRIEREQRRLKSEREAKEKEKKRLEREVKEMEKKKKKNRVVSQRTLVRRRLESLEDAEKGLSRMFSTQNVLNHPTSSPLPPGLVSSKHEEGEKEDEDDVEFDELIPPSSSRKRHPSQHQKRPRWFLESQEELREKQEQRKLQRVQRLELVLKRFCKVDGTFQHAADISIEKRFGVDNRARFDCLKKDKLGVWRTRRLIVDRNNGTLENVKQGELVWKKISISNIQTCDRVDDVHMNINFNGQQRTYKLRFPTSKDSEFFLKTLNYVQDEISSIQERKSRDRASTLERQASSLRYISKPQVKSLRLDVGDHTVSATEKRVRMEFIAKDLSISGEMCTAHFRPQISRLVALGMMDSTGGSCRSRFELCLRPIPKKKRSSVLFGSLTSRLRSRKSLTTRTEVINIDEIATYKKDRSNDCVLHVQFGLPWYISMKGAIRQDHRVSKPRRFEFKTLEDRSDFCVSLLWSKKNNRDIFRKHQTEALMNSLLSGGVGKVWFVGFNSTGRWQPHNLVWRLSSVTSSRGLIVVMRNRSNQEREIKAKFSSTRLVSVEECPIELLPQRSTMPLDARPVCLVIEPNNSRGGRRGARHKFGVVFGNHEALMDFKFWCQDHCRKDFVMSDHI